MKADDERKGNARSGGNESRLRTFLVLLLTLRFALVGVVLLLGVLIRPAWQGLFEVGILGAGAMTADAGQATGRRPVLVASAIVAWVSSLLVLYSFAFGSSRVFSFNLLFAEMAWLIALAICPLCRRSGGLIVEASKSRSPGHLPAPSLSARRG